MSAAAEEAVELETALQKKYLAQSLDILRTLSAEARFNFGRDGLNVRLVDPANAAMHFLSLDADGFEDVPGGQVTLGIDLDRLSDAISKAGASDVVTLGYIPSKGMLNVSYGNVSVDIMAIDPESVRSTPDDPELDLSNEFTIERETLADALDIVDLVSDHVKIDCYPEERIIEFIGEGDTDSATYELGKGEVIDGKVREETRSMYSMAYLWDRGNDTGGIAHAIPDGEVTLSLDEEMPVEMEYGFADGHGEVMTMLSPRIVS